VDDGPEQQRRPHEGERQDHEHRRLVAHLARERDSGHPDERPEHLDARAADGDIHGARVRARERGDRREQVC